jgi:putrescine transport system permease protein
VLLGTLCASAWTRKPEGHPFLGFLATTPLVIPEIITGLSLLMLFVWLSDHLGFPQRGMFSVIIAHTTLGVAYVTTIVRTRLLSIDPTLAEAALDLGARPYRVFFLIKFPLLRSSLVASWLIAFIVSFDDVVLASFTAGPGTTTLPIMILSTLKIGHTPQINALATCIVVMASILIMSAGYVMYQKTPSENR